MAWKETPRAAAVLIRRRFRCDEVGCNAVFEDRVLSSEAPVPACPACESRGVDGPALPAWVPPHPAIGTTKSKAIDIVQKMAEEDYGLTDMNDNQRVGDIAFKGPATVGTAEAEAQLRQIIEMSAQVAAPLGHGPILPDGSRPTVPEDQRHLLVDPNMQRENFWNGNMGGGTAEASVGSSAIAKPASEAARRDGAEPLGILEKAREGGNMPFRMQVMGSCTAEEALASASGG